MHLRGVYRKNVNHAIESCKCLVVEIVEADLITSLEVTNEPLESVDSATVGQ
jgi:hypothetical protein